MDLEDEKILVFQTKQKTFVCLEKNAACVDSKIKKYRSW